MKIDALGFVEARGLIAAIEAADAMIKAANVKLIRQHQVDPRFITLVVEGDLAACRAAVDAGVAAASRLGEVVSRLEIGRPDSDTTRMVLELIGRSKEEALPTTPKRSPPAKKAQPSSSAAASAPSAPKGSQHSAGAASAGAAVSVKTPPPSPVNQEILSFIKQHAKGRTWAEIVKRFPDYDGKKKKLDEMLESGLLRKVGSRYLAPSA